MVTTTVRITTPREITSPRTRYRGARQKQPGCQAGLNGEPLFVQSIAHLHRAVKMVTLADKNERKHEPSQAAEQDSGVAMEHHIRAVRRIGSKKPFTKPAANRNHQRG